MVKRTIPTADYVAGCLVLCALIALACIEGVREGETLAIAPALLGGLIAGGTSALGGIIGGIKSRLEKNRLEEQRNTLATINRGIQGRELSQTSQAAIRRAEENADEANRRNNTNAIKGGATDEARIANAKRTGDYVASVTSQAYGSEQRSKDAYRDRATLLDNQLAQQEAQNAVAGAQGLANAIAGAGTAIGGIVGDGKKSADAPSATPLADIATKAKVSETMAGKIKPITAEEISIPSQTDARSPLGGNVDFLGRTRRTRMSDLAFTR